MVFMSYYLTASVLYEHHGIVTRMDLGFRPVHQDHVVAADRIKMKDCLEPARNTFTGFVSFTSVSI